MIGYHYQKWFFDFLTDRGDYLLFFLSMVGFLGRRVSSLSYRVRLNCAELRRRTIPLSASFRVGTGGDLDCEGRDWSFRAGERGGRLRFQEAGFRVRLEYPESGSMAFDPGLTVKQGAKGFLRWRPLCLTGGIRGEIMLDGATWALHRGIGYIDHVSSNIPPYAIPARRIMWGRAAREDFNLTYTWIAGRGMSWAAVYVRIGDEKIVMPVTLTDGPAKAGTKQDMVFPDQISLRGASAETGLAAVVRNRAAVVTDRFLDDPHVRPRFANRILGKIARNPRSTKYLADFDIRLDRGGSVLAMTMPGINECAVFD